MHARALAAAEHEQTQRIGRSPDRASAAAATTAGPHRIAGERRFRGELRLVPQQIGERRGDGDDARRQQPVGAPDHGIGVVDQRRHAAPCRRQHRRHGRIAAEADHRGGLQPADQRPGLDDAETERRGGSGHGDRIAPAQRRAGDHVNRVVGEARRHSARPGGRSRDERRCRVDQRRRERFGREQMAAGPAGRDQDRRPVRPRPSHRRPAASEHSPESCACGRSRVSAISMPMP